MKSAIAQRIVLAVLPAVILVAVVVLAIWGDNGLFVRAELSAELRDANQELSRLDRENQRLMHDLEAMQEDPIVVERMVAEEIGWGHEGATIYRFDR